MQGFLEWKQDCVRGERQQDVAPYHPLLGKLIYVMAAFNQVPELSVVLQHGLLGSEVQGFFLQDLIPRWMALLLTVMVLICVCPCCIACIA